MWPRPRASVQELVRRLNELSRDQRAWRDPVGMRSVCAGRPAVCSASTRGPNELRVDESALGRPYLEGSATRHRRP